MAKQASASASLTADLTTQVAEKNTKIGEMTKKIQETERLLAVSREEHTES